MHFALNASRGKCAGGAPHMLQGARYFTFPKRSRFGGEDGWDWCTQCQCMFFSGGAETGGRCRGGGVHRRSGSPGYVVWADGPNARRMDGVQAQPGWRRCHACAVLFHGSGQCVAKNDQAHVPEGTEYALAFE
jgi:hypothetical protein